MFFWQINVRLAGGDWKIMISDFQSQFVMSKIIRIFLKIFFIEEYQFRGIFVVIEIFWKHKFLNHFVTKIMPIFQSPPAKPTLICPKNWKSAIFHSIKPPFDTEVAEKFLNGIYYILPPLFVKSVFCFKLKKWWILKMLIKSV